MLQNLLHKLLSSFIPDSGEKSGQNRRVFGWLPVLLLAMGAAPAPVDADIRFPADAGVVDVTAFGAIPDDGRDDTAAIQAALDSGPSGNHIFYFPNGTYRITDTLRIAQDDGVTKRNILQGQSEAGTILKLDDDLGHDDAIVDYRSGPAQFFRNSVRDLTFDIGTGNPDATGLKFNASNQGTVKRVTIRSGEGGRIGLDLSHSGEIGPCFITHVTVDGFAKGIVTRWQTASQTFEHITLRNQSEVGWHNLNTQTVFARGLTSENAVPAIINNEEGRLLLVDATLTGLPGAEASPAIRNQKGIYLRNVTVTGYAEAVTRDLIAYRGNRHSGPGNIDEYWANGAHERRRGGPYTLFPSPPRSLGLPVAESPEPVFADPEGWTGPHRFGGRVNDGEDDTAAIRQALQSGARTVFFPRGRWILSGTVDVPAGVRHILGTESNIRGGGTFRIEAMDTEPLVIERLQLGGIDFGHASRRTLVLQHLLGGQYAPATEAPGDVFLTDVTFGPLEVRNQRVWARQLNIESDLESDGRQYPAKVVNDGGHLWILGYKTEDQGPLIQTVNGGLTELLGSVHVGGYQGGPAFVTIDSGFSAALTRGPNTVRETRGGETREGSIGSADLYSAYPAARIRPAVVILDNADAAGVRLAGEWTASSGFPGGFLGADFLFSAVPGSTATFRPGLARPGSYAVAVRWVDNFGGQPHSGHAPRAPIRIDHAGGSTTHRLDQRDGGGRWQTLGTYAFTGSQADAVVFSTDGAGGKVIVDAVRFTRIAAPGE
ncbi:MAG: glycosyl hydrolase family 28-related protein [Opitutales bacterium]